MRITADISVSNRSLAVHNVRAAPKASRSSLAIGRRGKAADNKGNNNRDCYLLLCTAQNRNGTEYKLASVCQVFSKFAGEGKATVRLADPPHDLCVTKCDPVALKAFLRVLERAAKGGDEDVKLTSAAPAPPRKQTLILRVEARKDYPYTQGFPSELRTLELPGLGLKKLDARIPRLRDLTVLSCPNNRLARIPEELGVMRALKELRLPGNEIDQIPPDLLRYGRWGRHLAVLDLSGNGLRRLPNEVGFLQALVSLDVSGNDLERLPMHMARMTSLRYLKAAGNSLRSLPGPVVGTLALEDLHLDGNPLEEGPAAGQVILDTVGDSPAPLVDLCLAKIPSSVKLTPELVPAALLDAHEGRLPCFSCGKQVFTARMVVRGRTDLGRASARSVSTSHGQPRSAVAAEAVLGPCCSRRWEAVVARKL